MSNHLSRALLVLAATYPTLACTDSTGPDVDSSFAAVAVHDRTTLTFDALQWVACANGGGGEAVHLTGTLHALAVTVTDENGGTHTMTHFQPMGITGRGMDSGAMWRGTGVTRTVENDNGDGASVETFVSNFYIVGTGRQPSLMMHVTGQLVADANGELRVDNYTLSVDCS